MKKKKPKLVIGGRVLTAAEARKVQITARISDELPPVSELERLRDAKDYFKQLARRAQANENRALNIAAINESGYIDAILRLAQERVDKAEEPQDSAAKSEKPKRKQRAQLETENSLEKL